MPHRLPQILHERHFETVVLAGDNLALVGFWADWSGACHLMAPVVEAIARELEGRMNVVLVDVDRAPRIRARYGVVSVPTLLFFRHGQLMEQIVGTISRKTLSEKALSLLVEGPK